MSSHPSRPILTTSTLSVLLYFFIDFVAAICYYPDQTISPQDVSCSDSGDESNCCGPGYACLSNKVCSLVHLDENGNFQRYTYGRGSCTDQRWRSSACPSICILGSTRIDNCDESQKVESNYCCAAVNGTLPLDGVNGICDCQASGGSTGPLHFEGNASAITTIGLVASSSFQSALSTSTTLPQTSSIQSMSSTSTALTSTLPKISSIQSMSLTSTALTSTSGAQLRGSSTSTNASPTLSTSSQSSSQPSNKRGVVIGATVGTSLALIALGVLAFFLYRKMSHPRHEKTPPFNLDPPPPPSFQDLSRVQHELLTSAGEYELPARQVGHELLASTGEYELPARQVGHELSE